MTKIDICKKKLNRCIHTIILLYNIIRFNFFGEIKIITDIETEFQSLNF